MFRRREAVPFAFVAEADRFRSNVTPPPRERATAAQLAGRSLVGLTVLAGLAGSLLLGLPALAPDRRSLAHSADRGRARPPDSYGAPWGGSGGGLLGSLTGHSNRACL